MIISIMTLLGGAVEKNENSRLGGFVTLGCVASFCFLFSFRYFFQRYKDTEIPSVCVQSFVCLFHVGFSIN